MKVKKDNYFKLLTGVVIIALFVSGIESQSVEEFELDVGAGADINLQEGSIVQYERPLSIYVFQGEKISSTVRKGKGLTIGNARENRQLKSTTKSVLGFEKIYLFSEAIAEYGIKSYVDILFANPSVNDSGVTIVFNGRAEDAFMHKVEGYPSSADFLSEVIKKLSNQGFFVKHYDLMDLYRLSVNEGKCLIMPYLEYKEEGFEVTGLALFRGLKMVRKLDSSDAKYLNIMRENKVKGMLTVQRDSKKYLNYYATSKRKVRCSKDGEKYKFTIEIECEGNLVSNELFENLIGSSSVKKQAEKELEEEIKKQCKRVVSKLQKEYRIDAIQLGSDAAAKYGRHSGKNWDEIVSDSIIEVKAKVKIDKIGRGDF